jgi:hypothetical protein
MLDGEVFFRFSIFSPFMEHKKMFDGASSPEEKSKKHSIVLLLPGPELELIGSQFY